MKLGTIGVDFNGGFAQLASVPEADVNLVHLPEEVRRPQCGRHWLSVYDCLSRRYRSRAD